MGGILKKASKLFKNRKYTEVIRFLEPQVFQYRESFDFYYFLGASCLHTGDYGGAYSYLQRGNNLKPGNINTLLCIAAIHFKRREIEKAVKIWLDILDKQPGNPVASRGLKIVQKNINTDSTRNDIDFFKINTILPAQNVSPKMMRYIIALIIVVPILFFTIPYIYTYYKGSQSVSRPEIESITIDNSKEITDYSGQYRYIYSQKEILEIFEKVKSYFYVYRDNIAMKELNRILHSNASTVVKKKAELLTGYIKVPDFITLKDSFSYSEVVKDPFLYENCYVIWKGRVSNLNITDNLISFDFLVGYQEEKVLEGIVPVTVNFAVKIEPSYPIEILAKIIRNNNSFTLIAVSIHQLGS